MLYQTPRRTGFSVGMGGESRSWFRIARICGLIWATGTVSESSAKSVV